MAEFVEVRGLRELQDAMLALPRQLDRRVLNAALSPAGRIIANEAKLRVAIRTGNVRRNIRARPVRPMGGHTASVIVSVRRLSARQIGKLKAKGGKQGANASDPWYWRHVEMGTSRMRARPFLRPAFEAKKVEAAFEVKNALRRRIEIEAKKLRGWAR